MYCLAIVYSFPHTVSQFRDLPHIWSKQKTAIKYDLTYGVCDVIFAIELKSDIDQEPKIDFISSYISSVHNISIPEENTASNKILLIG